MDNVDRFVEKNEEDAREPREEAVEPAESPVHTKSHADKTEPVARPVSTYTSSSDASSVAREEIGTHNMSRIGTQRDNATDLEKIQTVLSRIETQKSQHSHTVGSLKSRASRKPLPEFGGGKPYPPPLPEREEYVVEFDGADDPLHAQNWPMKLKIATAVMLGYTTLCAAFGSSIFSAATRTVAGVFHVSTEVGVLGVSLYVLGFATGPIFWAPFSELYGRRLPIVIASFGFAIFNLAVAVGKDLQTVIICRFWAGFFGACPLTCVAAVFSDMFNNRTRGLAVTVFSMSFITMSYLGWRWTEYLTSIMGFAAFGLNLIFLKESYPPVILVSKASELRRRTKNWGIHAKQEEIEVDFRELIEKNFSRPLRMLVGEPIVLLISIYMAFIYGLLYLFLTAYPIVFQQIRGFNLGVGGLPFFGMILGQLLAGLFMVLRQPQYQKKLAANGGMPVPEWRLPEVILGGAAFAGGLFWFGWSGYQASTHWIVPTLSGLLTGFGLLSIFLQLLNYLVDAYLMFAASAIAANTFLRSLFGAIFPLFATYMFQGMGVQWASTLLGCVALILVPVPVYFLLRGAKIRERSKFAPTFPPRPAPQAEGEA